MVIMSRYRLVIKDYCPDRIDWEILGNEHGTRLHRDRTARYNESLLANDTVQETIDRMVRSAKSWCKDHAMMKRLLKDFPRSTREKYSAGS